MSKIKPPRISTAERKNRKRSEARLDVFEVDGKVYTMPAEFPPAAGIRYLRNLRDRGLDYAQIELLTEALGPEAVDVLAEHDEITHDEMVAIIAIVMQVALGAGKGSQSGEPS